MVLAAFLFISAPAPSSESHNPEERPKPNRASSYGAESSDGDRSRRTRDVSRGREAQRSKSSGVKTRCTSNPQRRTFPRIYLFWDLVWAAQLRNLSRLAMCKQMDFAVDDPALRSLHSRKRQKSQAPSPAQSAMEVLPFWKIRTARSIQTRKETRSKSYSGT